MDDLIARIESYIPKGDGYNSEFAHDLAEAVELLRERQWVSVSDRRPEPIQGSKILGHNGNYAFECEFEDDVWCNIGGESFIYWMPLPPIEQERSE